MVSGFQNPDSLTWRGIIKIEDETAKLIYTRTGSLVEDVEKATK